MKTWLRQVGFPPRRLSAAVLCLVLSPLWAGCLVEGLDGGPGASCQPHFETVFEPCQSSCDASNVVLIDGSAYCTSTCSTSDNSCPSGHVCVQFATGDTPPSACLPPCGTGADCPSGFLGLCSPEGICGL